ncbi:MAG: acyl-CoA synthetase [Pseudomonadota bacterium]|nr:acyl-CoA synthetase [Pseudomonadota bacterium]
MKSAPAAVTTGSWVGEREKGSSLSLRAARWIALTLGRRVTRGLQAVGVAWVVLTNAGLRRHSRRYLNRALGRPAHWRDVWRHVFTFTNVILDRIYLLQQRFDAFTFEAKGIETILEPFGNGVGVLAFGAHVGSFEALRMIGHDKGLRVAMIMYEDNARLLNQTLAAIAPDAGLHTITLGRVDAMLSLRRWLDEGGVAGLLADRTLPGQSQRSKTVLLPFLGSPAPFSDGPFRLAAMLRRKVVFMAGLYRGGTHYDLRFAELADFGTLGTASGAERDVAIRAALECYVATLESLCREAPYNWFNFYDFWAEEAP